MRRVIVHNHFPATTRDLRPEQVMIEFKADGPDGREYKFRVPAVSGGASNEEEATRIAKAHGWKNVRRSSAQDISILDVRKQGQEAAIHGASRSSCPYPAGSVACHHWEYGWDEGNFQKKHNMVPPDVKDAELFKRRFPNYDAWMQEVDRACKAKSGLSIHDLEDCPFRDWYDAGVLPASAAARCIKRSGGIGDAKRRA